MFSIVVKIGILKNNCFNERPHRNNIYRQCIFQRMGLFMPVKVVCLLFPNVCTTTKVVGKYILIVSALLKVCISSMFLCIMHLESESTVTADDCVREICVATDQPQRFTSTDPTRPDQFFELKEEESGSFSVRKQWSYIRDKEVIVQLY